MPGSYDKWITMTIFACVSCVTRQTCNLSYVIVNQCFNVKQLIHCWLAWFCSNPVTDLGNEFQLSVDIVSQLLAGFPIWLRDDVAAFVQHRINARITLSNGDVSHVQIGARHLDVQRDTAGSRLWCGGCVRTRDWNSRFQQQGLRRQMVLGHVNFVARRLPRTTTWRGKRNISC